jgi:hypothetical protein
MEHSAERVWSPPRLTVLVRSQPEETVLIICKGSPSDDGPNRAWDDCATDQGTWCSQCNSLFQS